MLYGQTWFVAKYLAVTRTGYAQTRIQIRHVVETDANDLDVGDVGKQLTWSCAENGRGCFAYSIGIFRAPPFRGPLIISFYILI